MSADAAGLLAEYVASGSRAHYAALMTPERHRLPAAALLAYDAQMRALTGVSRDVAPNKLHWWHEELTRLASGEPRHPVTVALSACRSPELDEALNARLHAAVVDFNEADVADNDLERYLHMRSGALFEALAIAAGGRASKFDRAAGEVCAIGDLVSESRDPASAGTPVAGLRGLAGDDLSTMSDQDYELAILAVLRLRRDQAMKQLVDGSPGSITGSVLLALYKSDWPRIIGSPPGEAAPRASAWSRLWTAWRAARRHPN